jgi:histone-lysine N-methyltransferase SETMAR
MIRITVRWIPHLLTNERKQERIRYAKPLLKMFQEFNRRRFNNVITGEETWVHFFEPHRKIDNNIWATRNARRPTIAKRTLSVKKVMVAVFFNINGILLQVSVPRGRSVTGRFYKQKVSKSLRKSFRKRRRATGLRGVC